MDEGFSQSTSPNQTPNTDITEAIPAFLLPIGIPLTYSINDGLAFGFVSYPLVKLAAGRRREVHPAIYALAALVVIRYIVA